jgi:hypothetical protein
MLTNAYPQLPAEIILLVAEHLWYITERVANQDALMARQRRMLNFSKVSRLFNWAATKQLYRVPELRSLRSLVGFADTVNQYGDDLGSNVRILRLRGAIDGDIPYELFERLLPRLGKNLISFEAPLTSRGINGLTFLSMCSELQNLDLSGFQLNDHDGFSVIKRAIIGFEKLEHVALPSKMLNVRTDDSLGAWPASLQAIKLGGTIDPQAMRSFKWPLHPFKLTIQNCWNLSTEVINGILEGRNIRESLKHLHISYENKFVSENGSMSYDFTACLYSLSNLVFLRMPLDMVEHFYILPAVGRGLPLQVLLLDEPYSGGMQKDFTTLLREALDRNLCNLVSLALPKIPSTLWCGNYCSIHNKMCGRARNIQGNIPGVTRCENNGLWDMNEPQDVPTE